MILPLTIATHHWTWPLDPLVAGIHGQATPPARVSAASAPHSVRWVRCWRCAAPGDSWNAPTGGGTLEKWEESKEEKAVNCVLFFWKKQGFLYFFCG